MADTVSRRVVVGVSGASGIPYAKDLLETLRLAADVEVHLVATDGARRVATDELGVPFDELASLADIVHPNRDVGAAIASGSFRTAGMVVVPCSATTLSKIAYGICDNLLTRAAYVHLKERRPLVLVPREAPLPLPTLEAMVKAAQAGATILPASPGFYARPKTIDDLLGFVTQRILDLLGIEAARSPRWKDD
ncbi:MAG TPA: UbiX family flavin prenyltransferase [Thermoanaerobaculia bacterium]|nr:UbiX family flavin prenyltransferase [Thermoanaerobaculia bacterium]